MATMDDPPRTRNQKKMLKDGRKKPLRRKQSPEKPPVNTNHSANGNLSWPRPSSGLRRMYQRSSSFNLVTELQQTCVDMEVSCDDNTSQLDGNGNLRDYFPFTLLPIECQMKIIGYLSQREKGKCALVCRDWGRITRIPELWTSVDLTDLSQACSKQPRHCSPPRGACHNCYRDRAFQFVDFLSTVKPSVVKLVYQFDIANKEDNWLELFYRFVRRLNCAELRVVNLNWKETPTNPYWQTCARDRYNDMVYMYRRRSRQFVNMFDDFTKVATNLTTLILPFVWCDRSVKNLVELKHLEILVIEKYFFSQNLDQSLLAQLLSGLPKLRKLMLEIWMPNSSVTYSLRSDSLEYLDVSQSRGLNIRELWLPALKHLIISRYPWNQPFTMAAQASVPCLFNTIVSGGLPRLQKFNDLTLCDGWTDEKWKQLDLALQAVCPCNRHRQDWLA